MTTYRKTLILTRRQVSRLIDMPLALEAVRSAFILYGKGRVEMPPKIYLQLKKHSGDFRAMPAYLEGLESAGLKWVNVHPGNRDFGLPAVMAVIILSDPKTGFPLAIMDGTLITNLRTGAAGGIAAKCLARKDSSTVGLVGCGVQAKAQLLALKEFFRISSVFVWGLRFKQAKIFLQETRYLGLKMQVKDNIRDCVKDADIIVTTTPSRKPLVKSDWIKDGVHINAIGADAKGKEELDPGILKRAKIIVDDKRQACHSGEINVVLSKGLISERDIYATLGEVLTQKKQGRVSDKEITVFDSTGLAIQDIACARLVYQKAIKLKIGNPVKII